MLLEDRERVRAGTKASRFRITNRKIIWKNRKKANQKEKRKPKDINNETKEEKGEKRMMISGFQLCESKGNHTKKARDKACEDKEEEEGWGVRGRGR